MSLVRLFISVIIALIFSVIFLAAFPTFNDLFRSVEMYGTLTNDTGTATGSPVSLSSGTNTITITGNGLFTVYIASGTAVAASVAGGGAVVPNPTNLVQGSNTITANTGGTGNITITTNRGVLPITGGIVAFMPYILVFGAILIVVIIIQSRAQS